MNYITGPIIRLGFVGLIILLFSSILIQEALAVPSVREPKGGWAVSRISGKADADPYCVLTRRFHGNFIVTVARNAIGETSLAVDFQRDVLRPSRSYTIDLKVKWGIERSYEVIPVSRKAMVIMLGRDRAFYQGLLKHQSFGFTMPGGSFEFVMRGMQDGEAQLQACIDSLPQSGPRSARSTAPDYKREYYADVEKDMVIEKEARMSPRSQSTHTDFMVERHEMAKEELMRAREQMLALKNRLDQMEVHNERLRAQQQSTGQAVHEQAALLENENRLLRKELEDMEHMLAIKSREQNQGDEFLRERLARVEQELEDYKAIDLNLVSYMAPSGPAAGGQNPRVNEAYAQDTSHPVTYADQAYNTGYAANGISVFSDSYQVQAFLREAGVNMVAPVERVKDIDNPDFTAFQWDTGDTYGSMENVALQGPFAEHVHQYLTRAQGRCDGDYASIPVGQSAEEGSTVARYDIACISAGGNSSASLLFAVEGGRFITIAHESVPDAMEGAMSYRDSLADAMLGSHPHQSM